MTTPDDKTLDALISELRTYPGLYGDAGAKSADAIAALRERIDTLEKEQTELDKVRYDEIMALREQNGALSERIAALESMLRVCRSAFEQRGLMTYVWEIDSTTARAAIKEGK